MGEGSLYLCSKWEHLLNAAARGFLFSEFSGIWWRDRVFTLCQNDPRVNFGYWCIEKDQTVRYNHPIKRHLWWACCTVWPTHDPCLFVKKILTLRWFHTRKPFHIKTLIWKLADGQHGVGCQHISNYILSISRLMIWLVLKCVWPHKSCSLPKHCSNGPLTSQATKADIKHIILFWQFSPWFIGPNKKVEKVVKSFLL